MLGEPSGTSQACLAEEQIARNNEAKLRWIEGGVLLYVRENNVFQLLDCVLLGITTSVL